MISEIFGTILLGVDTLTFGSVSRVIEDLSDAELAKKERERRRLDDYIERRYKEIKKREQADE